MNIPVKLAAVLSIVLFWTSPIHAQTAVPDVATLLQQNQVKGVETFFSAMQQGYEKGQLSEDDLARTFRLFREMDPASERNLIEWAAKAPRVYVAHLGLGIHYLWRATKARGGEYISKTPPAQIDEMLAYLHKADNELVLSTSLTAKPFLSARYLIEVYGMAGQRELLDAALGQANRIQPSNALARRAYARFILPRWGGSQSELDGFIEKSKGNGATDSVITQLEAIKYDDLGLALEEQGKHPEAKQRFLQALQLGEQAGRLFSAQYLGSSRWYLCRDEEHKAKSYCRQFE